MIQGDEGMFKKKLETMRMELNQLFNDHDVNAEKILKKSQELDALILQSMVENNIRFVFPDLSEKILTELIRFLKKIQFFEYIYEGIRIVDPVSNIIFDLNDHCIKDTDFVCHKFWGEKGRCENCISKRAIKEYQPYFKLEYKKDVIFFVTAIPIQIEKHGFVIEMLKKSKNIEETEDCIEVFSFIDAMNSRKLETQLTKLEDYFMTYSADEKRYDTMTYRTCGKSGLKLPVISLGLWHNFGANDALEKSKLMARKAFDLGITHFDLANNYGVPVGSAEETFGKILKTDFAPYRDELIISTKAGYTMWPGPYGVDNGTRKYLVASLDQSLKRMGLDYVDIFYHHKPDPNTPLEETMRALDSIVRQGKALYIALSNYYEGEYLQKALDILQDLGTPCLIHQVKYSMLNRKIEDGALEVAASAGVGTITFSSLAQGVLSNRYLDGIPSDSRAAGPSAFLSSNNLTEKVLEQVRKLNEIAQGRGQELSAMALAWVLNDPRVTSVIIGASKVEQIEENVQVMQHKDFSTSELNRINEILSAS